MAISCFSMAPQLPANWVKYARLGAPDQEETDACAHELEQRPTELGLAANAAHSTTSVLAGTFFVARMQAPTGLTAQLLCQLGPSL